MHHLPCDFPNLSGIRKTGQGKMSRMKRADAEEIRNQRIDRGRLPHDLREGGSVIRNGAWHGHTCFWDCG